MAIFNLSNIWFNSPKAMASSTTLITNGITIVNKNI